MYATQRLFTAASAVIALTVAFTAADVSSAGAAQLHLTGRPATLVNAGPIIPTVQEAQRLAEEGRVNEALKAYHSIIDNARITRDYVRDALEGLANLHYGTGNIRGAAQTFDELGGVAETFGDGTTELTARFKAALLFQETHDKRAVALQIARIRVLLKSPAIPAETREAIAKRMPA
jgi:hypothetical protein